MNKTVNFVATLAVVLGCSLTGSVKSLAAEQVLFEFDRNFDLASVITSDAKATQVAEAGLRIKTGHEKPWPGITL